MVMSFAQDVTAVGLSGSIAGTDNKSPRWPAEFSGTEGNTPENLAPGIQMNPNTLEAC